MSTASNSVESDAINNKVSVSKAARKWLDLRAVGITFSGLLIAALALSVVNTNRSKTIGEKKIRQQTEVPSLEHDREDSRMLADYFAQMRSLIFSNGLIESPANPDAEIIAKALTQNVMRTVGSRQNKEIANFLRELGLMQAGITHDGEPYALPTRPNLLSLLQGADLPGAQLSGVQLSISNLSGADLSYSNLQGTFLGAANLEYANFYKANLTGTDLNSASLKSARFVEAQLVQTILGDSNLSEADFSNANIIDTTTWDAELRNAKFTNTSLADVTFSGSDLSNTDFSGATISAVRFVESDLSNANMSGIQPGSRVERTEYSVSIDFTDAILTNTDLRGTDLRKAKVTEAQLESSLLCATRLPKGFTINPDKDCSG